MTTNENTIRILSFNDKPEEFRMWIRKFLSQAQKKGYRDVLQGKGSAVPPHNQTLDPQDPNEALLIKARNANDDAYMALILACDGPISFGAVERATTIDLPDGDAKLALDNLYDRFEKTKQVKHDSNSSGICE